MNEKVTRGADDASSCSVLVLKRNDVRPSAVLVDKNKEIASVDQCSVFDENSRIFKIKYIYFKILGLENTIYRVFSKIPNKIK